MRRIRDQTEGENQMARYILTKEYSTIKESCGVLQNLSGYSNIEITADTNEAGIILKPFQTLTIDGEVYARQSGGSGTCQLVVLPFKRSKHQHGVPSPIIDFHDPKRRVYKNPYDDFDDDFFEERPPRRQPPPVFPAHFDKSQPLSVQETKSHFLVGVSKESLKGQKKFLIQFED